MSTRSAATCWGRLRRPRATSKVRARLSRRSSSSRLAKALRAAWRIVSRLGAVARKKQAAESEHNREQGKRPADHVLDEEGNLQGSPEPLEFFPCPNSPLLRRDRPAPAAPAPPHAPPGSNAWPASPLPG